MEVRYGPDITDDAAQIIKDIVEYDDYRSWYVDRTNRGEDISMDDRLKLSELERRNERARELAKKLFGLSEKDMNARKFGLANDLARYSDGSISLSDTRIDENGIRRYAVRKSRTKPTRYKKGKKKGQLQRRTVRGEHERRGEGAPGRGYRDDREGGANYLSRGRVTPALQALLNRQQQIAQGKMVKGRDGKVRKMNPGKMQASIDALDISRGEFDRGTGRTVRGTMTERNKGTIRPPQIVKASAEAARQPVKQAVRAKAVKKATKPKAPKTSPLPRRK
jgi:hypothetical protein